VRSEAKKAVGFIACREVDEPSHALADFGTNGLQLIDLANGGIKPAQARKGFRPHLGQAAAAKTEDSV
jgi:hypothetical protein